MATNILPDQSRLRELLDYAPETGELIWKDRPCNQFSCESYARLWNSRFAGRSAGADTQSGRVITVDGKHYQAHRVAFKHYHGHEPRAVGFRNNDRADLRIENLYEKWPEPSPLDAPLSRISRSRRHLVNMEARRAGRREKKRAEVLVKLDQLKAQGASWRKASRELNVHRHFTKDEISGIHGEYGHPAEGSVESLSLSFE